VAPFKLHLLDLGRSERAEQLYQRLLAAGLAVLYDDRAGVSAGTKFSDADLIGCPIRLVISKRTGERVEWKRRDDDQTVLLSQDDLLGRLLEG